MKGRNISDIIIYGGHSFLKKLSSAQRKDYAYLHVFTDTLDVFAIKHVESRWLTMKYVALRTVEQWANLQEYFMKFLPKQNGFTKLSQPVRHQCIAAALKHVTL